MTKILVTGGLGFIGMNLVRMMSSEYGHHIIVADAMTYAAHSQDLLPKGTIFERIDIRDQSAVGRLMHRHRPDVIFHLAAETHVCRSISGPRDFFTTNISGTWNLLEEWLALYKCRKDRPFIHVSTDEVFGELRFGQKPFNEFSPLASRSPYAASKASSDLLVLSYFHTFGMPVRITNCSNNYGQFQHEEKLIPSCITRILEGKPVRLYGAGDNSRDWIHVQDHCSALIAAWQKGKDGQRYCIGGGQEMSNIEVAQAVFAAVSRMGLTKRPFLEVEFTNDRPTDDTRYAIDGRFAEDTIGFSPQMGPMSDNLKPIISWYAHDRSSRFKNTGN